MTTLVAPSQANGSAELAHRQNIRLTELFDQCKWYELALVRHGWTGERLQKTARRVVNDFIRLKVPYLAPHRRDDLVDYVTEKGLQAALRFRPDTQTTTYTTNGGNHFDSWIPDKMHNACMDWYRSKHEGNGDRRYGNDNRIVLDDDPDPADHDTDFEQLIDGRRRAKWQQAADRTGWSLSEWIAVALDKAAEGVLRSAA